MRNPFLSINHYTAIREHHRLVSERSRSNSRDSRSSFRSNSSIIFPQQPIKKERKCSIVLREYDMNQERQRVLLDKKIHYLGVEELRYKPSYFQQIAQPSQKNVKQNSNAYPSINALQTGERLPHCQRKRSSLELECKEQEKPQLFKSFRDKTSPHVINSLKKMKRSTQTSQKIDKSRHHIDRSSRKSLKRSSTQSQQDSEIGTLVNLKHNTSSFANSYTSSAEIQQSMLLSRKKSHIYSNFFQESARNNQNIKTSVSDKKFPSQSSLGLMRDLQPDISESSGEGQSSKTMNQNEAYQDEVLEMESGSSDEIFYPQSIVVNGKIFFRREIKVKR